MSTDEKKECPYCAEEINVNAKVCRFCKMNLATGQSVQQNINVSAQPKNVGLAIMLAGLFGPLGLLYSSVKGGLIMIPVSLILVPATAGFGLIIVLPVCMFWAASAAKSDNKQIRIN